MIRPLIPVVMYIKDVPDGALISIAVDSISPTHRKIGRAMVQDDEMRPGVLLNKVIINKVIPENMQTLAQTTGSTRWVNSNNDVMMVDFYSTVVVFLSPDKAIDWINSTCGRAG